MDTSLQTRINRKAFLKRAAAVGMLPSAASVLAACGGSSGAEPPETRDSSRFATRTT